MKLLNALTEEKEFSIVTTYSFEEPLTKEDVGTLIAYELGDSVLNVEIYIDFFHDHDRTNFISPVTFKNLKEYSEKVSDIIWDNVEFVYFGSNKDGIYIKRIASPHYRYYVTYFEKKNKK